MILDSKSGYSLLYNKERNRITIFLPQTIGTVETTVEPIVDRKTDVSEECLSLILKLVQYIFEKGDASDAWQV